MRCAGIPAYGVQMVNATNIPFSECLKDDTAVDETILLDKLFQAVTALFGNENNSESVLQLVKFEVEKWSMVWNIHFNKPIINIKDHYQIKTKHS